MGKDIKKRFTVSLDIETKDIEKQVKATVGNLKTILADLGSASDKMGYFKELVDYIGQIDTALTALRTKNKDTFDHMFDGLDADLKKVMESIFNTSEKSMSALDNLRNRLNDALKNGAGVKELRRIAVEINSLFTSLGKVEPIDIDAQFSGRGNTEDRIKLLTDALDNFATVWDGVNNKVKNGFGFEGTGGVVKFSEKVQKEIDILENKIQSIQKLTVELQNVFKMTKAFNDGKDVPLGFDATEDAARDLLEQFRALSVARQKFLEDGDTSSSSYYENLIQYTKVATQLIGLNDELAKSSKGSPKFLANALSGEFVDVYDFVDSFDKKFVSGIQNSLNKIILDIQTGIDKIKTDAIKNVGQSVSAFDDGGIANTDDKIAKNRALVGSYEDLSNKINEYYNILQERKKFGEDSEDFTDLSFRLDGIADYIEKIKSLSLEEKLELNDIFGDLTYEEYGPEEALKRICNMLQVEIPSAAKTAKKSLDGFGKSTDDDIGGPSSGSGGTVTNIDFTSLENTIKSEITSLSGKLDSVFKVEVVKNDTKDIKNAIDGIKSTIEKISASIDNYNALKNTNARQAEINTMKNNLTQLYKFVSEFNARKIGEKYQHQEIGAAILSDGSISTGYGEHGTVPWDRMASSLVANLTKSLLVDVHSHPWAQFLNGKQYANDAFSGSSGDLGAFRFSKELGAKMAAMITGNIMRTLDVSKLTNDQMMKFKYALADIEKTHANTPEYSKYMEYKNGKMYYRSQSTLAEQHRVTDAFESLMYKAFERIGFSRDKVDKDIFKKYNLTDDAQLTELAERLVILSQYSQNALNPVERLAEIISHFGGDVNSENAKNGLESYAKGELTAAEVFNKLNTKGYTISQDTMDSLYNIDTANEISAVESLLTQITSVLDVISTSVSNIDASTRQNMTDKYDSTINDLVDISNGKINKHLTDGIKSIFDPLNISDYKNQEVLKQTDSSIDSFQSSLDDLFKKAAEGKLNIEELNGVLSKFYLALSNVQDATKQINLYEERTRTEVEYNGLIASGHLEGQQDRLIHFDNLEKLIYLLSQAKIDIGKTKDFYKDGFGSSVFDDDNNKISGSLQSIQSILDSIYGILHGFTGIESDNKNSIKYKEPVVDNGVNSREFSEQDLSVLNSILQALHDIANQVHLNKDKSDDTIDENTKENNDISELVNLIRTKLSQQLATEDTLQAVKTIVDSLYNQLSQVDNKVKPDDQETKDQQESDVYKLLANKLPQNVASEDTLQTIRGAIEQISELLRVKDDTAKNSDIESLNTLISALTSNITTLQDVANGIIQYQKAQKSDTTKAMVRITDPKQNQIVSGLAKDSVKTLGTEVEIESLQALANGIVKVEGAFKNANDQWEGFTVKINENNKAVDLAVKKHSALANALNKSKNSINPIGGNVKKGTTYGLNQLQTFTAKYNSLIADAKTIGITDDIEVVRNYTNALQALIRAQQAFKVGEDLTSIDGKKKVQVFKDAQVACAKYSKELNSVVTASKKLASNGIDTFDLTSGEFDLGDESGRRNALNSYIYSLGEAVVEVGKFSDASNKLHYVIKNGDGTFTQMTATINKARTAIVATAGDTDKTASKFSSFFHDLTSKFRSVGTYFAASFGIQEVWQQIRRGIEYVREIDNALTELKKVTDETDASYDTFLHNMSKTGSVIGATVSDLTTMAADWARLGYSIEEAGKLAESTAILLNVSEFEDATSASEALISTMQAFQYTADESQHVVDILNEVGNNYAVSSDGIATALQDSASALMEAGNNLEQSVALVAAANKVVQDPNSVGSALRTISLRLRGTSVSILEEMGEETDGVVESVSKMQEKIEALTGVNILTDSGAYKDTYTILQEIGTVWEDMSDIDQAALLELMAGKNRANTLAAILGNMEDLEGAYESALKAEGSALKENEAYLDSIQGRIDLFTNSLQTMWMNFIDSSVVKFIVDIGTALIKAADSMGVLSTAISGFVGIKAIINSVKNDLKSLNDTGTFKGNIFDKFTKESEIAKNATEEMQEALENENNAVKDNIDVTQQAGDATQEHIVKKQVEEGVVKSSASATGMDSIQKDINTKKTWMQVAAEKAWIGIKGLAKGLLIGAAVSLATTALTSLISAITDASKRMDELTDSAIKSAEETKEAQNSISDYKDEISDLRAELDSNTLSESEAYDARQRLIEIQNELIDKFGLEAEGLNLVTGAINDQANALDKLSQKAASDWMKENMEAYKEAKSEMSKTYDSNNELLLFGQQSSEEKTSGTLADASQDVINAYKNGLKKVIEEYGGTLSEKFSVGVDDLGREINFNNIQASFENKTVEELDRAFDAIQTYLLDFENDYDGIDLSNEVIRIQNLRNKYVDEDYKKSRELYDSGRQQEAIANYAKEYGEILDAEEEIYNSKNDEERLNAIKKYRSALEAAKNVKTDDAHMDDYFDEIGEKFDEQEFELKIKLDEDGLKSNLETIIKNGGENGLSVLDDVAIQDMINRGLNVEGAIDSSGKYTQEQISGLILLQAEADKAGVSIASLIAILTNLGLIAGQPIEKSAESVKVVSETYSTLLESVDEYNEILSQTSEIVSDNTKVSQEYKDSLSALGISQEELNECFDNQNPLVVKNAKALNDLVKYASKNVATNVKLAKSHASLDYYNLIKELNSTLNSTNSLDSATRNAIQSTLKQVDAVKQAIYQYQLLEDSLLGAQNAFDEFNQAQEIDALNTYGNSYVEMVQTLYDGLYKTGQVGTAQFQAAAMALIPDDYKDSMQEMVDYFNKNVASTLQLKDDQFSFDFESIENFVEEGLKSGIFTGNIETFDLVEGMNLERAAELMGMTEAQVYAMFAELDKYNTDSTENSFLSQLDDSLEGRITNITNDIEKLNRHKLELLEDDGYEKNKEAIDQINQKLSQSSAELNKLGKEAYTTWQEYTKNDAAIAALDLIENKQRKLTKEEANKLGIEWDKNKELTVQQAYDQLLAKQLKLGEPTILTAQLAIDHIDSQIDALEARLKDPKTLKVEAKESGKSVADLKAEIEQKIQGLQEEKTVIATEFGIELSEEDKKKLEDELNAIEEFKIKDKKFTVVAKGTSEVIRLLEEINAYAKDVTQTVTTVHKTVYTSDNSQYDGWTHTSGSGGRYTMADGTAHVNGTAYKGGSWGAPKTETALVGELGPEMLVRNGRWTTIGDNGAEFTKVKKGDIIFNHKQTEELLSKGYVTGRGKAYASGTAYSGLWNPISPDDSISNKPGNDLSSAADNLSGAAGDVSDAADEFRETFDWIEIRLEEINEDLSFKSARLENTVGYSKQNKVVDDMIDLNEKLYDNLIAGANKYYAYAGTLLAKIPAEYRQAAQDGSIAIETFVGEVDEKTLESIQEYREWVQKGDDAVQRAEEVITEVSTLAKQAVDNIASDFENKASLKNNKIDQLDAYNALSEAKYGSESEDIYKAMIEETNGTIKTLQSQRDKMQAELNAQVEAGNIKKYSQDWYDAVNNIAAVDTEIIELTADTYDYQDAMNEIHWDNFDNLIGQYESISEEAENLIDILGTKDLVDEFGNWTDEGIASLGLYAQQMENAEIQADKYKEQINYLNKNWKKLGYTEQEYLEKLEELKSGQYDAIKAYNDTKDAIVDLNKERVEAIKDGIEKEIDAYEELISKKKDELDAEKDLYDFQKGVAKQQKDIADIERKIAALSADNSASARAKRAKLEAELLEAQAALEETYYERSINEQQDALDKELESFKNEKEQELEGWDTYLENAEQVVADSLSVVKENTETVYNTLNALGQEYSLNITEALTSPWRSGSDAIQDFSEKFRLSMSSTVEELQKIADEHKKIMEQIDGYGSKVVDQVNDNAESYQEANNPSTQKFDPPETVVTQPTVNNNNNNSGGGSSGGGGNNSSSSSGVISGLSAWLKEGNSGSNVRTLQTALNDLGFNAGAVDGIFGYNTKQAVMRFQSSSKYGGSIPADGIVGPETKKKFKVAGYASGTTGVKKNQLSIVDELGDELIMHADGSGRLAFLSKGSAVIPHDISENLMQLGKLNPQDVLDRNRPVVNAPNITNNNIELNVNFGEVVHIDHVDNNAVPNLAKTVEKQIEKYMKGLNAEIRKFTR